MSAWVTVSLFTCGPGAVEFIRELPSIPACYALYLDGSLHYVGQTINLQKRMYRHGVDVARYSEALKTPWGYCKRLHLKYRPSRTYGDWAMVELRLIKRLQPAGNQAGVTRAAGGVS